MISRVSRCNKQILAGITGLTACVHSHHYPVIDCLFSPCTTYTLFLRQMYGSIILERRQRCCKSTHTHRVGYFWTAERPSASPRHQNDVNDVCVVTVMPTPPIWIKHCIAALTPASGWWACYFARGIFEHHYFPSLASVSAVWMKWEYQGMTMLVLYYFTNTFGSWMWGKTLHRKTLDTG